jgi:hypothetical protein
MKNVILFLTILLSFEAKDVTAQLTRVQFIHNSPTLGSQGGPAFDIYINDVVLPSLRNFKFRSATPFLSLPSDINLTLKVRAWPSTLADSVLYSIDLGFLEEDKDLIACFSGVLGNLPGLPPFNLQINDNGKQVSDDPSKIDLSVYHGSILMPKLSFKIRNGNELFIAEYGDYTTYTSLNEDLFYLDVDVIDFEDLSYTHKLDLTGLAGKAGIIFASGPAIGSPQLGFYLALPSGQVRELPFSPVARMQWIHASLGTNIDVYINNEKVIADLAFKKGTPFMYMAAEEIIQIGIAPPGSSSANDITVSSTIFLENNQTYTAISAGIPDDAQYPFSWILTNNAKESAANSDFIDIRIGHASPWTPPLDISALGTGQLADNLSYSSVTNFFERKTGNVFIDFRSDETDELVASFTSNLDSFALSSAMSWVLGSVNPEEDDLFLTGIFPDGSSLNFERIEYVKTQLIHNSPGSTVDIYLNDILWQDNFQYRKATPFLDIPAGFDVSMGIAPANSQSVLDTFSNFSFKLEKGNNHHIVLSGVVGNPNLPLQLFFNGTALLASSHPDSIALVSFAGSQGAPELNLISRTGYPIFNALNYGTFSEVQTTVTDIYQLDIQLSDEDETFVTYEADLSYLGGASAMIFMSGIFGGDPEFGLFLVLADGTVIPLQQRSFARMQIINNLEDDAVDVYLNGELLLDSFAFKSATSFLDFDTDKANELAFAPKNSLDVSEAFATYTLDIVSGKNYYAVFQGNPFNPEFPVSLNILQDARVISSGTTYAEFSFIHGLPKSDTFSGGYTNSQTILSNLSYGFKSAYLTLENNYRLFKLNNQTSDTFLGALEFDNIVFEDKAFAIVIGGINTSHYYGVLPDGTVIPLSLKAITKLQFVQNLIAEEVDFYINQRKEQSFKDTRSASPFLEVKANEPIQLKVVLANDLLENAFLDTLLTIPEDKTYAVFINGDIQSNDFPPRWHIGTNAKIQTTDESVFSMGIHNGSPQNSSLDFIIRGGTPLFLGLGYGQFSAPRELTSNYYIIDVSSSAIPDEKMSFLLDSRYIKNNAGILFASGYNQAQPSFSLSIALANGSVIPLRKIDFASVQWLHNSPHTGNIDLYLFGEKLFDNISFRSGTAFNDIPAGVDLEIQLFASGMTGDDDELYSGNILLEPREVYSIISNGIQDSQDFPLNLSVLKGMRFAALDDELVDLRFMQGSPGLPMVDLNLRYNRALISGWEYGQDINYLSLLPTDYVLDVNDNSQILETFLPDFFPLKGQSNLIVASGLRGDQDEPFGLFLVTQMGEFIPISKGDVGRLQFINNTDLDALDLYWDGIKYASDIAIKGATSFIPLPAGQDKYLAIAPGGSTSVADAIFTADFNLSNGSDIQAIAYGEDNNIDFPLNVAHRMRNSLQSSDPDSCEVSIFHGSSLLDSILVRSVINDVKMWDNPIGLGTFSIEKLLEPYAGELAIRDKNDDGFGWFFWTLQDLKGQSITLFTANGSLINNDLLIEVWVALTNGITYPLEGIVSVREAELENQKLHLYPNPNFSDRLSFTIENEFANKGVQCKITNALGRTVLTTQEMSSKLLSEPTEINISHLSSGWFMLEVSVSGKIYRKPFIRSSY